MRNLMRHKWQGAYFTGYVDYLLKGYSTEEVDSRRQELTFVCSI